MLGFLSQTNLSLSHTNHATRVTARGFSPVMSTLTLEQYVGYVGVVLARSPRVATINVFEN